MFRALETEYQVAMDKLYDVAGETEATDKAAFQRLLRRITLRTSARNQFVGTVSRIVAGPVDAQVFVALGEQTDIAAQVTSESIKRLDLAVGQEIIALVKAPAVFLVGNKGKRTTDTNYLDGVVSRINKGTVNSEVVVDVPLSRVRHVAAIVTTESVAELGLKAGAAVTAAFPASSVILTTFG